MTSTLTLHMAQLSFTFVVNGHVEFDPLSKGDACSGYTLALAQRYRGIVFAVEHRFFG